MLRIALGGMLLLAIVACQSAPASARAKSTHARKPNVRRERRFLRVTPRQEQELDEAPVSIEVLPAGWADPQHQRLRVVVTPQVDARLMEVAVDATEGLYVASGRSRWTSAARADQPAA